MIKLEDIKPFPCLPGATVVAVESSDGDEPSPAGEVTSAAVIAAIEENPEAVRTALNLAAAIIAVIEADPGAARTALDIIADIENDPDRVLNALNLSNPATLNSNGFFIPPVFTTDALPDAGANEFGVAIVTDVESPTVGSTPGGGGASTCAVRATAFGWVITEIL